MEHQSISERQSIIEEKINQMEQQFELTCEALENLTKQIKDIKEALERPAPLPLPGGFF
jgi:archaellum component FlaC